MNHHDDNTNLRTEPALERRHEIGMLASYDSLGGWTLIQGKTTGFFAVEKIDNRYWLINPEGNAFLSKGINAVRFTANVDVTGATQYKDIALQIYGSEEAWAEAKVKMLREAGFNTAGGWSDDSITRQMPYVKLVNIAVRKELGGGWFKRTAANIYSNEFPAIAAKAAEEVCRPLQDDPLLIGYMSDNEMPWMKGADSHSHILLQYLVDVGKEESHRAALEFVKNKYPTIEALNTAWISNFASWEALISDVMNLDERKADLEDQLTKDCQQFALQTAEIYFRVVAEAIRKADPNHLLLGTRVAWLNTLNLPIIIASAKYLDVVTINNYADLPFTDLYEQITASTGKPIMVTEFAFRGQDSGHGNTKGAGWKVKDQTERASRSEAYLTQAYQSPVVVGTHWFCMTDQPLAGRKGDGENSNYGIQKLDDSPWPEMMEMFNRINKMAEELHQK